MAEEMVPQWHICPVCRERFLSTQSLGSHKFWKHEYKLFKAKRLGAQARGENLISLRGIGGIRPSKKGPPPGIGKIVRDGKDLILLE
jgi:hypothetical protein